MGRPGLHAAWDQSDDLPWARTWPSGGRLAPQRPQCVLQCTCAITSITQAPLPFHLSPRPVRTTLFLALCANHLNPPPRVLNDTFRSLSSSASAAASQRPMALLSLTVGPRAVDVNVTPDKRKVFLAAEDGVVALLQQVG